MIYKTRSTTLHKLYIIKSGRQHLRNSASPTKERKRNLVLYWQQETKVEILKPLRKAITTNLRVFGKYAALLASSNTLSI